APCDGSFMDLGSAAFYVVRRASALDCRWLAAQRTADGAYRATVEHRDWTGQCAERHSEPTPQSGGQPASVQRSAAERTGGRLVRPDGICQSYGRDLRQLGSQRADRARELRFERGSVQDVSPSPAGGNAVRVSNGVLQLDEHTHLRQSQ